MKIFWLVAILFPLFARAETHVTVGSKIFTEGYILGEIASQTLEANPGVTVDRKLGMGSTGILFESLKSGAIDVYADYTGTLAEAILKRPELKSAREIAESLAKMDLVISAPLGFNNTYALAVREGFAAENNLRAMSDLTRVEAKVRLAFSYEFMDRADGFKGMVQAYSFRFDPKSVTRMEHSLAYQAIGDGAVDVIEVYSTDAKIKKLGLRVLADDKSYFPAYQAVWVARKSFVNASPLLWTSLRGLEGRISEEQMRSLNAGADLDKKSYGEIASEFLGKKFRGEGGRATQILHRTGEHLWLVGIALFFSILVGVPLGIAATRFRLAGQSILLTSALVQTIPSLALLCFLIPFFGVGAKPALVALCLYSLLPVVLNTFTGISAIEARHLENARAYGLNKWQILFRIILPLASPTILAGIKTATIVSIGTATLAALVGAGGYGVPIISGLSLNDMNTVLTGALPAAGMALVAYGLFEIIGRFIIPAGLR